MIAASLVVLDRGPFWALVGLAVLASAAASVAALSAWRAAKAARAAGAAAADLSAERREADLRDPGDVRSGIGPAEMPVSPAPARRPEAAEPAGGPGPTLVPSRPFPAPPMWAEPGPPADPSTVRLQRLEDPDPFVRIEAIQALHGRPELMEGVLRALRDDFPVVRRQAVRALKDAAGPPAIRALLGVANQDPSAEVREDAVAALAEMLRESRAEHA
jgi:hypothetical protein